ncbi:hypothetical protein [Parenemella sanctibonifatiensis]|uniref:Uncharacterized protein n=1 Tax=Parenemella sanctibonifatiensis TaxID=2016505 RepID=A0A255E879_9ACTN|nr:hypothetical protein [Parenemella sanctibonifatiensis]OYN87759.1 hypothetical protein CGZ92_05670 [Parenemella sanctibonifatiensis]
MSDRLTISGTPRLGGTGVEAPRLGSGSGAEPGYRVGLGSSSGPEVHEIPDVEWGRGDGPRLERRPRLEGGPEWRFLPKPPMIPLPLDPYSSLLNRTLDQARTVIRRAQLALMPIAVPYTPAHQADAGFTSDVSSGPAVLRPIPQIPTLPAWPTDQARRQYVELGQEVERLQQRARALASTFRTGDDLEQYAEQVADHKRGLETWTEKLAPATLENLHPGEWWEGLAGEGYRSQVSKQAESLPGLIESTEKVHGELTALERELNDTLLDLAGEWVMAYLMLSSSTSRVSSEFGAIISLPFIRQQVTSLADGMERWATSYARVGTVADTITQLADQLPPWTSPLRLLVGEAYTA